MAVTAAQLCVHMRALQSKPHTGQLPGVYPEMKSEIHRLAEYLETSTARSSTPQLAVGKSTMSLESLARNLRPSFWRRGDKLACKTPGPVQGDQCKGQPWISDQQAEGGSSMQISSEDVIDSGSCSRVTAVRKGIAALQSSVDGRKRLLATLLHQEGLRVLDQCLAACLQPK